MRFTINFNFNFEFILLNTISRTVINDYLVNRNKSVIHTNIKMHTQDHFKFKS